MKYESIEILKYRSTVLFKNRGILKYWNDNILKEIFKKYGNTELLKL